MVLTATTLFLSTGALLPLLVFGPDTGDAHLNASLLGSLVTEILWAGLYALFFLLAFAHRQRPVATLLGDRIISLLLGLAVLSTLWSDSPSVSLWENARLIATTFFAIYLAKTYSLGDIFHMVAWITAVAAALSIIFALALPEYGLGEYMRQSVWTGVFDQKNTLGGIMALGALTWFIVALGAGQLRWLGVLVFAIMLSVGGARGIRDLAGHRVCIVSHDRGVCEGASVHSYSGPSLPNSFTRVVLHSS